MDRLFKGLILSGILIAIVTKNVDFLGDMIIKSLMSTWNIFLNLSLLLLLWSGVFQIAIEANLIETISIVLKKPLKKLFPNLDINHPAFGFICANFIANFIGIGSAATPLGLKAFEKLQETNKTKEEPTREMLTFLAINCSSLTIIPTQVLSFRTLYGGETSTLLILMMSVVTILSTTVAIILDRIFYKVWRKK